jgi:hypothetical protein
MSSRRAPAHGARRARSGGVGKTWARGVAIVVAVAGIGVGTWVLGSGPDSPAGVDGSAQTDAGYSATVPDSASSPDAPVVTRPPLSVAPVPPATAEQRDEVARATRKARSARP